MSKLIKKIFFIMIFFSLINTSSANERFIPLELFTGGEIRDDTEIKFTNADTIFGEKRRKKIVGPIRKIALPSPSQCQKLPRSAQPAVPSTLAPRGAFDQPKLFAQSCGAHYAGAHIFDYGLCALNQLIIFSQNAFFQP